MSSKAVNLSQGGQGYINIWRKKTIKSKIGCSSNCSCPRMDWSIGALVDRGDDPMPMHGGVRLTVTKMVHIAKNFFSISLAGFGQVMAMMVMMATCPRVDWSKDPLRTGTKGNMSMAMQKKAPNT